MWTVTIEGARILLGAHTDDFVVAYANGQVLDGFHARLLDTFEGTYEGALQHYQVQRGTEVAGGARVFARVYVHLLWWVWHALNRCLEH